jgi:hypothetical protein
MSIDRAKQKVPQCRKGNWMPCLYPSYRPCTACLMWHSAAPHLQPISRVANGITMGAAISIPSTGRRHGKLQQRCRRPGRSTLVQALLLQECCLAERADGYVTLAAPAGWALRYVVQVWHGRSGRSGSSAPLTSTLSLSTSN